MYLSTVIRLPTKQVKLLYFNGTIFRWEKFSRISWVFLGKFSIINPQEIIYPHKSVKNNPREIVYLANPRKPQTIILKLPFLL